MTVTRDPNLDVHFICRNVGEIMLFRAGRMEKGAENEKISQYYCRRDEKVRRQHIVALNFVLKFILV